MINTADAKVLLVGDRYLDLVTRMRPSSSIAHMVASARATAMPRWRT